MAKALTEKQLKALLKKAKTAKSIKQIVADNKYEVKLVKGMSIDDAKEAILKAAFPPAPEVDDFDDDEFGDDPGSDEVADTTDDFDDDDLGDSTEEADGTDTEELPDTGAASDDPEEVQSLLDRVAMLEKRLDAYESLLSKAPPASAKSGKAEKEAIKAKLLEGCPYTKKTLSDLNGREIKQLASGLSIKSFGLKREAVEAAILKSVANKKAGKK